MKKHLLAISFLSLFFAFAFGQPNPQSGNTVQTYPNFTEPMRDTWLGKFERQHKRIAKILQLTEPQKSHLDSINDVYVTQRAALMEDKSSNRRDRKAEIQTLQLDRAVRFKNLLSENQLKKWEELRKGKQKKAFKKK